jgi:hypothetical protein
MVATFDGRIGWNWVGARIVLIGLVKKNIHFGLGCVHNRVRNPYEGTVPGTGAEIGMKTDA